jgi:hypothetical protein
MHEMMDYQLWKQRREEMLREVERNRLVKHCGRHEGAVPSGYRHLHGR